MDLAASGSVRWPDQYEMPKSWNLSYSRVSVFENRIKEQPVMAKQMVKNIQFDLLEKRKEIDYLGRFLNRYSDWFANQEIELNWKPLKVAEKYKYEQILKLEHDELAKLTTV